MMGHRAVRRDDLRTASGRPRVERLRLRHCRRTFIELHQEKPPREILRLMRAAGFYSPRTCDVDALRSIGRWLEEVRNL